MVVGSGAREHALVWKLRFCPEVTAVYAAPGNAGIAFLAHTEPIAAHDIDGLRKMAREFRIDLTIIGPEVPLANGIVDAFEAAHLRVFGPTQAAARLESSKVYAKQLMHRFGIPTGRFGLADTPDEARSRVLEMGLPVVLKADGLAGGKGAVVCRTQTEVDDVIRQFMTESMYGASGERMVVEQFLEGEELSIFALTDGTTVLPLIGARDYKQLYDGDVGPNTGGMGGYAPSSYATPELMPEIRRTILEPTVAAMKAEGTPYVGVLYAGLMLTTDGPKVLEYNCRWGDPEAELILPLLKTDMVELIDACIDGTLASKTVEWTGQTSCGVVLASRGYPETTQPGVKISGIEDVDDGVLVFHGATQVLKTPEPSRGWLRRGVRRTTEADVGFVTDGGRVLTVVALGQNLEEARQKAYANVERIQFDGKQVRRDIGSVEPTPTRSAVEPTAAEPASPPAVEPERASSPLEAEATTSAPPTGAEESPPVVAPSAPPPAAQASQSISSPATPPPVGQPNAAPAFAPPAGGQPPSPAAARVGEQPPLPPQAPPVPATPPPGAGARPGQLPSRPPSAPPPSPGQPQPVPPLATPPQSAPTVATAASAPAAQPQPAPQQPRGAALVAVVMGSESDRPTMDEGIKILESLGIPHEVHVMSAHRTPGRVRDFSRSASSKGIEVIIAGAGGAAHLPGVIAGQTILPVIGVPMSTSLMGGLDSLLSIVQMPGGVPVATVATGNAGARNAAYLAAGILSLSHPDIRARYHKFRADQSGGELG